MAWTEDNIDLLRRLWDTGMTATEIAKKMDSKFSRSGIIGKANRLGLPRRENPIMDVTAKFERVYNRVIDAPRGKPLSIEEAAKQEGLHPVTAQRMWDNRVEATHGGPPPKGMQA